jgi:phosphoglycerate kinase
MLLKQLNDIQLKNKRIILREDYNVPLKSGCIADDTRIQKSLPTINTLLAEGAAIIILSHLGRPKEGADNAHLSLAPVAIRLASLLNHPVRFEKNYLEGIALKPGEIVLCENIRFNVGEKENDAALAKKIADLGDCFVMDAFATSHRSEASTSGAISFSKESCAGPLLIEEISALNHTFDEAKPPVVAIVGGAKISTKLNVIQALALKVDYLIPGGGIANTFLAALGHPIGTSLFEPGLLNEANAILKIISARKGKILLPTDVVVATTAEETATPTIKSLDKINPSDKILDIGPNTIATFSDAINKAGTIFWNGPVGAFELSPFSQGTKAVAKAIAHSQAYSVAGGGDTLLAVHQFDVASDITYLSTAGGALLEFLAGKTLPALKALQESAKVPL